MKFIQVRGSIHSILLFSSVFPVSERRTLAYRRWLIYKYLISTGQISVFKKKRHLEFVATALAWVLRSFNSLRILRYYQGPELTRPRTSRRDVLTQDDRNASPGGVARSLEPGNISGEKGLHCKSARRSPALGLADFVRRPLPTASPASPRRGHRGRPASGQRRPASRSAGRARSWVGEGRRRRSRCVELPRIPSGRGESLRDVGGGGGGGGYQRALCRPWPWPGVAASAHGVLGQHRGASGFPGRNWPATELRPARLAPRTCGSPCGRPWAAERRRRRRLGREGGGGAGGGGGGAGRRPPRSPKEAARRGLGPRRRGCCPERKPKTKCPSPPRCRGSTWRRRRRLCCGVSVGGAPAPTPGPSGCGGLRGTRAPRRFSWLWVSVKYCVLKWYCAWSAGRGLKADKA